METSPGGDKEFGFRSLTQHNGTGKHPPSCWGSMPTSPFRSLVWVGSAMSILFAAASLLLRTMEGHVEGRQIYVLDLIN